MMIPSELINMGRVFTCLSHECFLCRIAVVDWIVVRPCSLCEGADGDVGFQPWHLHAHSFVLPGQQVGPQKTSSWLTIASHWHA